MTYDQYSEHALCLPNKAFPPNLHEFDIAILDLKEKEVIPYRSEEHRHKYHQGNAQNYIICAPPENLFDPRPIGSAILHRFLEEIFAHKGILIIFADASYSIEYRSIDIRSERVLNDPFSLNIYGFSSFMSNTMLPLSENKMGYEIKVVPDRNKLSQALEKYLGEAEYHITFQHPIIWNQEQQRIYDPAFFPILLNGRDEIVGFARLWEDNLLLVLPQFTQQKEGNVSDFL